MSAKIKRYGKILLLAALALALVVMAGLAVTWSTAQTNGTATDTVHNDTGDEGSFDDANDSLQAAEPENVLSKIVYELEDQRNENQRVWQVEREIETIDPVTSEKKVETQVSDIIEVGGGICYQDQQDNWQVTIPHWRATEAGFLMDTAGYQLQIGKTIGSWLSYTVNGVETMLRPVAIRAWDGTRQVDIATLAGNGNIEGFIDPNDPSRLVFIDAFGEGIDLELCARPGGFSQNVIFQAPPVLPDDLDRKQTEISIYTELQLPEEKPDEKIAVLVEEEEPVYLAETIGEPKATKTTTKNIAFYREVQEGAGPMKYFLHEFTQSEIFDSGAGTDVHKTVANKQILQGEDGKTYLVESLENDFFDQAQYPVVWDYETRSGSLTGNNIWYAKNTYYLSSVLQVIGGTLQIEPGTVVKFATGAKLSDINYYFSGKIVAQGKPYMPIVFTSMNDNNNGCKFHFT